MQTRLNIRTFILATLALLLFRNSVHPADQTWSGGSGGSNTAWFTPANWVGNALPGATPAPANTTNIDLATIGSTGTNPDIGIQLNFTGNSLGLGAINFNSASRSIGDSSTVPASATLRLNGATVNSVGNVILRNFGAGTLTLAGSPNSGSVITGVMSVALGNATDNIINIDGSGGISINAVVKDGVSGAHITLGGSGSGVLTLSGANTFTGGTTISSGTTLNINNAAALGTGAFTINGGAINSTVSPFGPLINNNAMAWNGDFTFAGTNSLDLGNGAVSMNATRQITVNSNNLTAGGVISGTGFGVTKQGAGNLTLNGLNSYSGVTTINNGTITANTLANGGSNSSIGSSSNIASNLVINGGVLNYDSGSASSTNRLFTIGSSGAIIQNNSSSSAFTVNFTNTSAIPVSGTTDRTLTLRGLNTGDNTLSAALIDPSSPGKLSVTKDNLGTWILAGNNTYTGATTVNSGALLINGSTATGSAVTVNNSGTTLGGGGTIGGTVSVASGSHLSPGTTSAGNTATLNTGALTLSSGSFFNVDLNGTTAGSGYDQVSVTGLLAISGSNLVVTVGGGLQTGNKFFVALNDGTDAVTGTFAQGSTLTASNGYTFLINYTDDGGGGLLGNDISLTLTAVPEPRTWIGPALALAAISFTQLRKHSRAGGRRIQKKLQVVG